MDKQISIEQISKFSEEYNKNRNNKIIENAITKNGLENACIDRQVIIENVPIFILNYQKVQDMIKKTVISVGYMQVLM